MNCLPIVSLRLVKERTAQYGKKSLDDAKDVYEFVRDLISDRDREVYLTLCLDSKNRLVCINETFVGMVNSVNTCPREIFKVAILSNAVSIITVHNHPSGNPKPSRVDIVSTQKVKQAGDLLGIRLLDHVIIGDGAYYSFADNDQL